MAFRLGSSLWMSELKNRDIASMAYICDWSRVPKIEWSQQWLPTDSLLLALLACVRNKHYPVCLFYIFVKHGLV